MMYDAFPGKRDLSLANPYYYHAETTQVDTHQVCLATDSAMSRENGGIEEVPHAVFCSDSRNGFRR